MRRAYHKFARKRWHTPTFRASTHTNNVDIRTPQKTINNMLRDYVYINKRYQYTKSSIQNVSKELCEIVQSFPSKINKQKLDSVILRYYAPTRKEYLEKKRKEREEQSENKETTDKSNESDGSKEEGKIREENQDKNKKQEREDKEREDKESLKDEKKEEGKKEEKEDEKDKADMNEENDDSRFKVRRRKDGKRERSNKQQHENNEEEQDEEKEEETKQSGYEKFLLSGGGFIFLAAAVLGFILYREKTYYSETDWPTLKEKIINGDIVDIFIQDEAACALDNEGNRFIMLYPENVMQQYLLDLAKEKSYQINLTNTSKNYDIAIKLASIDFPNSLKIHYKQEAYKTRNQRITEVLSISVMAGLFMALPLLLLRAARNSGIGNYKEVFDITKKKNIQAVISNTTFKDVAGLNEAKAEVMEFVEFLKDPSRFTKLGARIPKGALLEGPPGTGKTLLAKAVAGEAGVKFYSMSGSEFVEMIIGVGPKRVRELFEKARETAPSIIFIDELDAVGQKRARGSGIGRNEERENTVNQILVEMDGFQEKDNVVVLAATNRASILDPALLRPGRFDRQIEIGLPDRKGREEIFQVHLRSLVLEDTIEHYAETLSVLTPGVSGADIMNICNEAALIAGRLGHKKVNMDHFDDAMDKIFGGLERKKRVLSESERNFVAHHEAGHATVSWFLENCDPLLKVSIVPRGPAALGYAQYLPREKAITTFDELFDRMCVLLGGRAAEEIMFKHLSTGASDDLNRVTKLAYDMVLTYGMGNNVGHVSYPQQQGGFDVQKPFSEETAVMVDEEVKRLISTAYQKTMQILTEKKDGMIEVATRLLEKEKIGVEDMVAILGPKSGSTTELDDYIKTFQTARLKNKALLNNPDKENVEDENKSNDQEKSAKE